MCGIAGVFSRNGTLNLPVRESARHMMEELHHRGPDDTGFYVDEQAVLAHTRLSIIDLSSAGHQPMRSNSGTAWLLFNGEIYNFRDLRLELESAGCSFHSETDSEVIIEGYRHWGITKLLSRLRGMFAFAIYDPCPSDGSLPTLILARDRFGIKPLYYHTTTNEIIFASEVRAMVSSGLVPNTPNPEATIRFLQLGSIPAPQTTVKDVFAIPAGHYLIADSGGIKINRYWDLCQFITEPKLDNRKLTLQAAAAQTCSLLEEAVKLHLISDVPLGVFLSGGVDSSSLVALASQSLDRPLTTLSIVFEESEFSEASYSRLIARKYSTDHREVTLSPREFYDELPTLFSSMDQPTVDGVNTYFVSKAAKEAGLTVVLSGTGGDEVFLGYRHFKLATKLDRSAMLLRMLPRAGRAGVAGLASRALKVRRASGADKLSYLEEPTDQNLYLLFRGLFSQAQIRDLLGVSRHEIEALGPISPALTDKRVRPFIASSSMLEFRHYLENQLLKDTDFMSMAHSIETRVPFLDHKLVELVLGLPPALKLSKRSNKPLLVQSLGDRLPREIWNRPKMGFTFPFGKWMMDRADDLIPISRRAGYLDARAVSKVWDAFRRGDMHWSRPWALMVLGALQHGPRSVATGFSRTC
jgi:asparagine synthase (glutamine-hydrolysing)